MFSNQTGGAWNERIVNAFEKAITGLSPKESKNVSLDAIEVHALFSDILERDALLQVPQVLNEGDNIFNQISAINVR